VIEKKGQDDDRDKTKSLTTWGTGWRPTCLHDKSHTLGSLNPEMGSLEDPDEGRRVHMK